MISMNTNDSHDPLDEMRRMAGIYNRRGRFDLAEQLYKHLVDVSSESQAGAVSLYGLGEFYIEQQRFAEATACFKRAVDIWERLHPQDALSVMWYTDALMKLQKLLEDNEMLASQLNDQEDEAQVS